MKREVDKERDVREKDEVRRGRELDIYFRRRY